MEEKFLQRGLFSSQIAIKTIKLLDKTEISTKGGKNEKLQEFTLGMLWCSSP